MSPATHGESGANEQVDAVGLRIPAQAELLILARLVAAAVAARGECSVDEIEDLRLAIDELCLSVMGGEDQEGGELSLELTREPGAIQISCTFVTSGQGGRSGPEPAAVTGAPTIAGIDREVQDLSSRILDALVDEHHFDERGTARRGWLRKELSTLGSDGNRSDGRTEGG